MLIRIGLYAFSAGRCRGQRRPAVMRNGRPGWTFWLPGLAFNVWKEEQ